MDEAAGADGEGVSAGQQPAPGESSIQGAGDAFLPARRCALDDRDLGLAHGADGIHGEKLTARLR